MPPKELISYMKIVWTNKPTEFDKVGCDGLYIKEITPSTSNNTERDVICTNSPCAYCVNENKDCKPIVNFACFHGCKLTPVS